MDHEPTPTPEPADDTPTLDQMQQRLDAQLDQLATAEAQRDEALLQAATTENRRLCERKLLQVGVADLETASLLLEARVDVNNESLDDTSIHSAVQQLVLDKPFLLAGASGGQLPGSTQSPVETAATAAATLVQAASRAAETGNRRDIAEYLRLRRTAGNR
jgi:hypothetical protein